MIRSMAALVEVPLAALKRSTISREMGERVIVVLREERLDARGFSIVPFREFAPVCFDFDKVVLMPTK